MRAGPAIRRARHGAGLTQSELAARLGVSQPAISRLERADANPTFTTFVETLRATGHDLELRPRLIRRPIDEGQIIERLKLTPAERLATFLSSQRNMAKLLAKTRRIDAPTP